MLDAFIRLHKANLELEKAQEEVARQMAELNAKSSDESVTLDE